MMKIIVDDLKGPEIAALLEVHLELMRSLSPPESVHALDLGALRIPSITFWTAWDDDTLLGCGALKDHGGGLGEIKSMHTAVAGRKRGTASQILQTLEAHAQSLGIARLSLETGSQDGFAPARNMYAKFGYKECGPFADYTNDPNSVFMTKAL